MDWTASCRRRSLSLEKFKCLVECFRRDSDIGFLVDAGDNLFWLILTLITIVTTNTNWLGIGCLIIYLHYRI